MEVKAMERFKPIIEAGDAVILLIMAVFTFLKQSIAGTGKIDFRKAAIKVFTNFVAGWGFYSFALAYDPWMGDPPQKIGVIMIVTYAGSHLIDVIVEKLYKLDWKAFIRKWLD